MQLDLTLNILIPAIFLHQHFVQTDFRCIGEIEEEISLNSV